jgi:hypothetical protein
MTGHDVSRELPDGRNSDDVDGTVAACHDAIEEGRDERAGPASLATGVRLVDNDRRLASGDDRREPASSRSNDSVWVESGSGERAWIRTRSVPTSDHDRSPGTVLERSSTRDGSSSERLTTETNMLFVTYWELNEAIPVEERHGIAETLTGSGTFPPDGVEVLRWDSTTDMWGIVVWEAEDMGAISDGLTVWRASGAGFFEETKTAPAAPVEEFLTRQAALLEELPGR